MLNRLQQVLMVTSMFSLVALPAVESRADAINTEVLSLDRPADWIAQTEAVQVTGIQVEETEAGLQVVLETTGGELAVSTPATSTNTLVVEIPGAVLALPDSNEFLQFEPAEGITVVQVVELSGNRVEVSIAGTNVPPTVEPLIRGSALVLSVTSGSESLATETTADSLRLVVSATRTEEEISAVPRSITVVTREQIETQSVITQDLGDILGQTIPGLGPPNSINRAANAQSLRGRLPLILIDGIPQQGNSFVNTQLEYISPDAIERVEVVRGPTAIYGQGASGGVINIITREPAETGFASTAEIGVSAAAGDAFFSEDSFSNYQHYGFSGQDELLNYVFSVSRNDVGTFFDADGDRVPSNNASSEETETFNFLGKVGFTLDEKQSLHFLVNHANNSRDINFVGDPATRAIPGIQTARALRENQVYEGTGDPRITSTSLNINYSNAAIFGDSELQAQAYYRDSTEVGVASDARGRFIDAINRFRSNESTLGGRLQIDSPLSSSLSVLWGADYEQQEEGASLVELFDPVAFDSSSSDQRILRKTGENVFYPAFDLDSLGLFAQIQWELSDQLLLSGGARYEQFDFQVDEFTPLFDDSFVAYVGPPVPAGELNFEDTVFNIGGVYDITSEVNVFASFAQGYSVPGLFSILNFLPVGFTIGEDVRRLQPQKVDNYEIGVRGDWGDVQASLAGFYNYSNLGLSSRGQPDGTIQFVRAPQRNYGLEAILDWQPSTDWQLGTSLTWSEGEDDQDGDGDFSALRTFEVQPLKLTAYIENQTTPDWRNRLQLLYVGNRDRGFQAGSDFAEINDYVVVDLISSIKVGPGNLDIGIQNLLNSEYFPVFSQVLGPLDETANNLASGRTLSIGYRVTW
ncbi:MAG: TonB-dependent receptor [Cyanobacteria bacterium P01_H01_bin.105]